MASLVPFAPSRSADKERQARFSLCLAEWEKLNCNVNQDPASWLRKVKFRSSQKNGHCH